MCIGGSQFISLFAGAVVSKKYFSDKESKEELILKNDVTGELVEVLPPGLDLNRQQYLFKEIREFCTPQTRDIVCPAPPPPDSGEPSTKRTKHDK